MGTTRLDQDLLDKLVIKTMKKNKYLREQISKRANKQGISSEAILVLWAKDLGIGTRIYQRKLSPSIQAEIRDRSMPIFASNAKPNTRIDADKTQVTQTSILAMAIDYLIEDDELRDRCKDLLKAPRNHDRVLREATTILEDRIRKLSGIKGMRPADLVSKVINPDPTKAIIKISDEAFIQQGFHEICKGLVLAFRDAAHHKLSDKLLRQDALKFCGFIDSILAILGSATKMEVN